MCSKATKYGCPCRRCRLGAHSGARALAAEVTGFLILVPALPVFGVFPQGWKKSHLLLRWNMRASVRWWTMRVSDQIFFVAFLGHAIFPDKSLSYCERRVFQI